MLRDDFTNDSLTHDVHPEQHNELTDAVTALQGTPPPSSSGRAAHYIGTWEAGTAYTAGDCVRQWDTSDFKLYQAITDTIGDDDPNSVAASWEEVTTPITMWGHEDPNTTDSANTNGAGITAPLTSLYLWYDDYQGGETVMFYSPDYWGNWVAASAAFADLNSDTDDQDAVAAPAAYKSGAGPGYARAGIYAQRADSGDGGAEAGATAYRFGSGAGNADASGYARVADTAVGTAYAGGRAIHHTGGEAHVSPTANATEAFNEVMGPLDCVEQTDPTAPASGHGRLYFRDNGSGKMQACIRFPTGAVQVVATEP